MTIYEAIKFIKMGKAAMVEEYINNSDSKNKQGLIKTINKIKYV